MKPQEFIRKWRASTLKERSAAHEHFLDLCRLLEERTPGEADPNGTYYCFERGAKKAGGGKGWADVWKRGCFGWEYKGKGGDLDAALAQLQRYAVALENPPLLIVSDIQTIRLHTNFTNTVQEVHELGLEQLEESWPRQLLKWAFSEPDHLKPGVTRQAVTEKAAAEFAELADQLRKRGHDPQKVAHFINRLLFCLFAEDSGLLANRAFRRVLKTTLDYPGYFQPMASQLFAAMRSGGPFGPEWISWFNGGLFDDDEALSLLREDVARLSRIADLNWGDIEPSIFGTLFERGLDPGKRSQLGAHYTDCDKIMMIVEPVIREPLAEEWTALREEIAADMESAKLALEEVAARALSFPELEEEVREVRSRHGNQTQLNLFKDLGKQRRVRNLDSVQTELRAADRALAQARQRAEVVVTAFLLRLKNFRVLDPACGSGNFLYLALMALKDLEHQVNLDAEALGLESHFPAVGPECVRGIEINVYAAELARVTVWIGEIQWMIRHGFSVGKQPILRSLETIERRDALLNPDGAEADWPPADVIIGNPPFLGNKKMIDGLGEEYVSNLRSTFANRLSGGVDLVCYWFEKSWQQIIRKSAQRAGLVATNSIRSGANKKIIEEILQNGRIFDAWDDEPWVVDGASVRVSLLCFDRSSNGRAKLDGKPVRRIFADLTAGRYDLNARKTLQENLHSCFVGVILNGEFEVDGELARSWLVEPNNINGKPNSEVLRPTLNGDNFNGERPDKWVVDFGTSTSERDAAMYEKPFQYILERVKPYRQRRKEDGSFAVRAKGEREIWWRHARSRPGMRKALLDLNRYIATPMVSSYRTFDFLHSSVLPDQKLVIFAKESLVFLGILESKFHYLWTKATCSWIGAGNDITYSNTSVYETFPFPDGLTPDLPESAYNINPYAEPIGQAASHLKELRDAWLRPRELVKFIPEVVAGYPERSIPVNRKAAEKLRGLTLSNLYGQRPAWLDNAYRDLDEAVAAAYGWRVDLEDEEILGRLLELNHKRAGAVAPQEDQGSLAA